MKRLLREPLLHFLLLGAALFVVDGLRGERSVRAADNGIVVTTGRIENLAALFEKTWQRPPTPVELKGLIDDHVLEEVLYREGLALGVDRDDTVIRRRVRQKMEFVLGDLLDRAEPTRGRPRALVGRASGRLCPPDALPLSSGVSRPRAPGGSVEGRCGCAPRRAARVGRRARARRCHAARACARRRVVLRRGTRLRGRVRGQPGRVSHRSLVRADRIGLRLSSRARRRAERGSGSLARRTCAPRSSATGASNGAWRPRKRFHEDVVARYDVSIEWPSSVGDDSGAGKR